MKLNDVFKTATDYIPTKSEKSHPKERQKRLSRKVDRFSKRKMQQKMVQFLIEQEKIKEKDRIKERVASFKEQFRSLSPEKKVKALKTVLFDSVEALEKLANDSKTREFLKRSYLQHLKPIISDLSINNFLIDNFDAISSVNLNPYEKMIIDEMKTNFNSSILLDKEKLVIAHDFFQAIDNDLKSLFYINESDSYMIAEPYISLVKQIKTKMFENIVSTIENNISKIKDNHLRDYIMENSGQEQSSFFYKFDEGEKESLIKEIDDLKESIFKYL
ncbi:MAG: hypothetical protein HRT47_02765 [Candidatus Caenarcaniphilales bacterium]|nr:hypothetical protein [Candidatus Caenarcaniphilales bacterium]